MHFLPYTAANCDAQSVLHPCMDGSGSLLYMAIPADRASEALDTIRTVLPGAAYA